MSDQNDKTVVSNKTLEIVFSIKSKHSGNFVIEKPTTLGRGEENDIVLSASKISRNHAKIDIINGKLVVEDLDSSNGTYVNGNKINKTQALVNGDVLSFDVEFFTVEVDVSFGEPATPTEVKTTNDEADKEIAQQKAEQELKLAQEKEKLEKAAQELKLAQEKEKIEKAAQELKLAQEKIKKATDTTNQAQEALPGSWIEESNVNDGTKILNPDSLQALLAGEKNKDTKSIVNETTLQCKIDGEIIFTKKLEIPNSDTITSWEIGRSSQTDIVIDHPSVSNRHAQIIHQGGRWKIVNLVSTNGIMVNDQKKLTAFLSDKDSIGLGSIQLYFRTPKFSKSKLSTAPSTQKTKSAKKFLVPLIFAVILAIIAYFIYELYF